MSGEFSIDVRVDLAVAILERLAITTAPEYAMVIKYLCEMRADAHAFDDGDAIVNSGLSAVELLLELIDPLSAKPDSKPMEESDVTS